MIMVHTVKTSVDKERIAMESFDSMKNADDGGKWWVNILACLALLGACLARCLSLVGIIFDSSKSPMMSPISKTCSAAYRTNFGGIIEAYFPCIRPYPQVRLRHHL
jgi:hypothetical protein